MDNPVSIKNDLGSIINPSPFCSVFLWDCKNNETQFLGRNDMFPADTKNPFDYFSVHDVIGPEYRSVYDVFYSQILSGMLGGTENEDLSADISLRLSETDSEYRLCHITTNFQKDETGKITAVFCRIRPFTPKEEFDREILKFFSSDKNPDIYSNSIRRFMDSTDRKIAFIQFDIERFKLINDSYGNDTGDALLNFIKESLDVICTDKQPHCRLTADVFMIVTAFDVPDELVTFIRLLESRLSSFRSIDYRFAFGVCIVPEEQRSCHTRKFGDNAGVARHSVKGNALKNIAFYNENMMKDLHQTQIIEEDMYKAIAEDSFVMYLQPKFCISTGRVIGAEALARWIHPEKGMISPNEFIPVFERNGFIIKLDQIIWESACKRIRSWIDRGIEPVPVSVNVSRAYLGEFDAVEILGNLVKKYDIPINLLELEITESVDADVDDIISRFKKKGFTMLMDDFGSGYSSLNMLKTTQFDVLKIDRNFLSEFMESDRGRKIISHTIHMSQDIGLNIIAEGVETKEQAEFLCNAGCDAAQGFLYSRPIPADDFDTLLTDINK